MSELDAELVALKQSNNITIKDCGKYYSIFLRTEFYIPCADFNPEEFKPLVSQIQDNLIMLAFDSKTKFQQWAGTTNSKIAYQQLIGEQLILGVAKELSIAINPINDDYKIFAPDEIKFLQQRLQKITDNLG